MGRKIDGSSLVAVVRTVGAGRVLVTPRGLVDLGGINDIADGLAEHRLQLLHAELQARD